MHVAENATDEECSALYQHYLRIIHRTHNKTHRAGTAGKKKRRSPTQFHQKIRNCSLYRRNAQKSTEKTRRHRERAKNCR